MKKLILILLVGLMAVSCAAKNTGDLFSKLPQKDLNEITINYTAKVYLIDVWATWCPPCRMTVPELVALQKEYKAQGLLVLGLSVDEQAAVLPSFLKEYKVNYPVAIGGMSLQYLPPVRGIPTMFIVDSKGAIVETFIGYTDQATLAEAIKKHLK